VWYFTVPFSVLRYFPFLIHKAQNSTLVLLTWQFFEENILLFSPDMVNIIGATRCTYTKLSSDDQPAREISISHWPMILAQDAAHKGTYHLMIRLHPR